MMTKREKKEMEDAISKAELVSALRWTEPVGPDVLPPGDEDKYDCVSRGWTFNQYSGRVDEAWSSKTSHSIGASGSASQGSMCLYSSRILAIRTMRHAMEITYAENLRRIDRMIRDEVK